MNPKALVSILLIIITAGLTRAEESSTSSSSAKYADIMNIEDVNEDCELYTHNISRACGDDASDFLYALTPEHTVSIIGYVGAGGDVTIPSIIEEEDVTAITENAFYECTSLSGVTIPNSVVSIGAYAFCGCDGLTNVTIGTGVSDIGAAAFRGCSKLTNATIGNAVTDIKSMTFAYCYDLAEVTIGKNVASIDLMAFTACGSLKTFTVDSDNLTYSSIDGVLFNKEQTILVRHGRNRTGVYSIPYGVTSIGNDAFEGCDLTGITVSDSVTNFGHQAFAYCSSLETLPISSNITSIGGEAFRNCHRLTGITIPDNVTSIGNWSFYSCRNLKSVTLGNGLAHIPAKAFYDCDNLTSITIPANISDIAAEAFADCSKLKYMYFMGNAPACAPSAFSSSASVTSYYLPDTTGWGSTFGGRTCLLWNPTLTTATLSSEIFSCAITGTTAIPIALQVSTNLRSDSWTHLQTIQLTSGTNVITNSVSSDSPIRFYRIAGPQ